MDENSKTDDKKRLSENNEPEETKPLEKKRAKLDEESSIGGRRKFKSPEMKRAQNQKEDDNSQISRLKEKIANVEEEIGKLDEFNCDELDTIINKLHYYNDVKDTAQFLIEKMAHIKCVTIKKMHEIYGMDNELD